MVEVLCRTILQSATCEPLLVMLIKHCYITSFCISLVAPHQANDPDLGQVKLGGHQDLDETYDMPVVGAQCSTHRQSATECSFVSN